MEFRIIVWIAGTLRWIEKLLVYVFLEVIYPFLLTQKCLVAYPDYWCSDFMDVLLLLLWRDGLYQLIQVGDSGDRWLSSVKLTEYVERPPAASLG